MSDGVVAIALTSLVLQLNVPSVAKLADPDSASELAAQLGRGADELISYVISFYVIAQFWVVHHGVVRQIAGQQEGLAWWNFAFLFAITLMPFTSDLLRKYPENPLAIDIFAANLLVASLTTQLTIVYGRRKHLLSTDASVREEQAEWARMLASVFVIVLSIGVAWVNTDAAKYCWLLLAVAPGLPTAGPAAGCGSRASPGADERSPDRGYDHRPGVRGKIDGRPDRSGDPGGDRTHGHGAGPTRGASPRSTGTARSSPERCLGRQEHIPVGR